MARPRKETKRTRAVTVKLTEHEHAGLMAEVDRHGLPNVIALVRPRLLNEQVVLVQRAEVPLADRHEVRRLGVNLNQIAHALNAAKGSAPTIAKLEDDLRVVMAGVMAWLTKASAAHDPETH